MIQFERLRASSIDWVGPYLPHWFNPNVEETAQQAIHRHYGHGGGWQPFHGFVMGPGNALAYPGDPKLYPVARATFRGQEIYVYEHSWIAVVNPDGSYEVCRVD